MPKKPNRTELQNYVPAGNGDVSGEYADEETGSNIHFTNFKKPDEKPTDKPDGNFDDDLVVDLVDDGDDEKKGFDDELMGGLDGGDDTGGEKVEGGDDEIIDSLDDNATKKGILDLNPDLDKNKVMKLSDKEANKLLKAVNTVNNANKQYEKLKKGENKYEGIWLTPMTPSELYQKYGKEGLLNSLKLKKDYFTNAGNEEMLQKVNAAEQEINAYIAKREKLDAKIEKAKQFVSKFDDPNNMYSQKRKDKAVWCKSIEESRKIFTAIQNIKGATSSEVDALKGYTSSFSFINEPLRGIKYGNYNEKKNQFIKSVKEMTSAIEKSVIDFDFWTQRGTSKINFPHTKIDAYTSEQDLQKLVGTSFEDQAFVSTGAAKNTGFSSSDIILNIYCPKGTKGAYVDGISHYKGENELILQRGYSYKVTKVEKKNGRIYMDCDLILDSDKNKFNDSQLEEIKNKYFM